jgi:hypothetical protein
LDGLRDGSESRDELSSIVAGALTHHRDIVDINVSREVPLQDPG